jgi:hypothetical protein
MSYVAIIVSLCFYFNQRYRVVATEGTIKFI